MLHHPTLDKLQQLRLSGMHKALGEQLDLPEIEDLNFEERLGLLADRELTERENRRLQTRLRQAKLRQNACLEDIDYRAPRGLDKALITQLSTGQWIRDGLNAILVGPTGVGKTEISRRTITEADNVLITHFADTDDMRFDFKDSVLGNIHQAFYGAPLFALGQWQYFTCTTDDGPPGRAVSVVYRDGAEIGRVFEPAPPAQPVADCSQWLIQMQHVQHGERE